MDFIARSLWILVIVGIAFAFWAIQIEHLPASSLSILFMLIAINICAIALLGWGLPSNNQPAHGNDDKTNDHKKE